jgi:hypothetical protein
LYFLFVEFLQTDEVEDSLPAGNLPLAAALPRHSNVIRPSSGSVSLPPVPSRLPLYSPGGTAAASSPTTTTTHSTFGNAKETELHTKIKQANAHQEKTTLAPSVGGAAKKVLRDEWKMGLVGENSLDDEDLNVGSGKEKDDNDDD